MSSHMITMHHNQPSKIKNHYTNQCAFSNAPIMCCQKETSWGRHGWVWNSIKVKIGWALVA